MSHNAPTEDLLSPFSDTAGPICLNWWLSDDYAVVQGLGAAVFGLNQIQNQHQNCFITIVSEDELKN